jgi:hypothetical protein
MTRTSTVLALLLMVGPGVLTAQRSVQATPKAPASGFDSFIMLVPPRDSLTIKKNLRAAGEAEAVAETRRQQAETMRLGARSTIESKKVQIGRLKERIAVAKKEGREADRLGMEAERKAAEREIDLLKRREELRQAEIDLEATRAEQASLTAKALQLELQLAIRRAGRGRAPVGGAGAASLDRVIGELEKQTLEAQRLQAASNIEVADREINVIDRRLWLLDAQERVLGGK